MTPACLMHDFHVLENLLGNAEWSPAAMAAEAYSPTRPHDDFNFEELLSDLITIARIFRPHLGSKLVSTRLTFGVHCSTCLVRSCFKSNYSE